MPCPLFVSTVSYFNNKFCVLPFLITKSHSIFSHWLPIPFCLYFSPSGFIFQYEHPWLSVIFKHSLFHESQLFLLYFSRLFHFSIPISLFVPCSFSLFFLKHSCFSIIASHVYSAFLTLFHILIPNFMFFTALFLKKRKHCLSLLLST